MPPTPPHDDADLRGALPEAPPPRPARRDAAIEAALRRFDAGAGSAVPLPPALARVPRWRWIGAPQLTALASVAMVAVIGIPAWLSNDHRFSPPARDAVTPSDAIAPVPATPPRVAQGPPTASPPASMKPSMTISSATVANPDEAASNEATALTSLARKQARAETESAPAYPPAPAPPPPPPPPAAAMAAAPAANRAAEAVEDAGSDIVVTSQRVSRKPVPRGDWNACTIDDPKRDLSACKQPAGAKSDAGRAAADVADGLSAGWAGDTDEAVEAFDRALAIAPGLSAAYLNRGLAYRRAGDLDRAIADLDQAVRLAPNAARNRYNRARMLRERGDVRRAKADERDALALDARYAAVIE